MSQVPPHEDPYLQQMPLLAPRLSALKASRRARLRYLAFADAFYWTDELPSRRSDDEENLLRILLRYRTTLVIGKPDATLELYWAEALRAAPAWVGFLPARRAADSRVIEFYRKHAARFSEEVREFFDEDPG